jgi:hypothetical protein
MAAFEKLSVHEIECAQISIVARSIRSGKESDTKEQNQSRLVVAWPLSVGFYALAKMVVSFPQHEWPL